MPTKIKEVAEDAVEEVVEDFKELPSEVLDISRKLLFRKEWMVPAAIGAGMITLGVGAGYLISRLKHKKTLDALEQIKSKSEEIDLERADQTNKFNHMMAQMNAVMGDFRKQAISLVGTEPVLDEELEDIDEEPAGSRVNIFRNAVEIEDWDYDKEVAAREANPTEPYVISIDEYHNNEEDLSQTTLTYYEGDEVLCDEKLEPLYNLSELVGELRFGHGSKDPNLVYIRNPRFKAEYEVIRDSGYYGVEVLGQEIEDIADDEDHKPSVQRFRKE